MLFPQINESPFEPAAVAPRKAGRFRSPLATCAAIAMGVSGFLAACSGEGGRGNGGDAVYAAHDAKWSAVVQAPAFQQETLATPHVAAATPEAAGRYLVLVGGCNDCHTPGYMQSPAAFPETDWLTGSPVGFRGPWGTTYASNLRLFVQETPEDVWVPVIRARHSRPPMPWSSLHSMSDQDLRAVHRFIRSLGAKGEKAPQFVPPGQEPKTPYVEMFPKNLPPAPQQAAAIEVQDVDNGAN